MSDSPDRTGPDAPASGARITRRNLLRAGAVIPLTSVAVGAVVQREMPWQEGASQRPEAAVASADTRRYVFFAPAEAAFVEAAVARLIPADELGPGAVEAGVPFYIDRQLDGDHGKARTWYMQGPWAEGEKTQGYQTRLTPAGLYRAAIREIDEAVSREAKTPAFAGLSVADQDAWLHRMEDGKLDLSTADAKTFFGVLHQHTLEGFWSDPIYGGNRDMVGWRLIGFPGARYDHSQFVSRHGELYPLPPVGLRGRAEWTRKG